MINDIIKFHSVKTYHFGQPEAMNMAQITAGVRRIFSLPIAKCQIMLKFSYMTNKKLKRKVQVAITYNGEILLLKLSKERGGFWQNVTGGVDEGETFLEAAKRELKEETNLQGTMNETDIELHFKDRFEFDVVEKVFYVILSEKKLPALSYEHDDFKWLPLNEITENEYGFKTNYEVVRWIKEKCI